MPQKYTIEELNKRALQARDDLNKIKMYLSDSPDSDAKHFASSFQSIIDNGNYRGSGPNELGSLMGSKYLDIRYYPTDGFKTKGGDKIKQGEIDRLKRLKSYYQWLKIYDRKNKKKVSPTDPKIKNAAGREQKKLLKQMTKIKNRSNILDFKNPTQVLQDFANQQESLQNHYCKL